MKASKIIAIVSSAAVAVAAIVTAVVLLVPGECKHESAEWRTVTEATCTADGVRNSVCKDCGAVLKTENLDKIAHTEVTDAAKAPTCTETGLTEGKHCSACNAIIVAQEPVDKVAHTYDNDTDADCNVCGATREVACTHAETEIVESKAATCTATGLTEGTKCKKCGETIVAQEALPMVAHTYDNKYDEDCNVCGHKRDAECGHFETETVLGKAATCTATGLTDGAKCKKCGEITVAQQTIPKIPHTEVKIPSKDATCTATGLTDGKKCSACGTVTVAQQTVSKIPHTEVKVPGKDATCTATGLTDGKKCSVCGMVTVAQKTTPKIAHTYDDKYDETCNKCGFVRDAECAHVNTETIGGYDSTCTATGLTDGKKCKKCGEITEAQKVIATKPHTEVIDAAVEATCTATGLTEGKHCSVCDTVTVAQNKVAMKPHTEVIDAAVAATCTSTGITEGKHCSVCETVIVAQTVTKMKPHTEVIDAAVEATCTETGLTEGKHCSVCNKTLVAQTETAMKPHTEVKVPGKAATCTSTGLTDGKRCSVCNATLLAQAEIAIKPHTEVIDAAVAPTCTATGLTEGKHCSVCSKVLLAQTTVEAKGHNYAEAITAPTCSEKGYTTYTCSNCNDSYNGNYVDTVAHEFSEKYCVYCNKEEFGEINYDTTWYSSSSKSFVITTKEELAGLSYLVYKGTNFSGKTVSLGANIDLGGAEWIPIGTENTAFAGTFDGKSFTISNLTVTKQTSYVGLFGNVSGTLKDFAISNASICTDKSGSYVAIACGYTGGVMSGISVSGSVEAAECSYVGGVAGRANRAGTYTHTNLTNSADISGASYVGGIFGDLYNYTDTSKNHVITISECSNSGNISGTDYIGGLFGRVYGYNNWYSTKITANILDNTGDVSGSEKYVGGIVGYCYSDDEGSFMSNANSSADIVGNAFVGGIAGHITIAMKDCNNEGSTVKATGYVISDGKYYAYLGGIAGFGTCFENCTNYVDITYESKGIYVGGIAGCARKDGNTSYSNLINLGNITGASYVGGIFGDLYNYTDTSKNHVITISECSNSGNISGTDYIGGLFGRVYVCNNWYSTKITANILDNTGNVTGTRIVGGIAGYVYSDNSASTMADCTNSGNVSGDSEVADLVAKYTNVTVS